MKACYFDLNGKGDVGVGTAIAVEPVALSLSLSLALCLCVYAKCIREVKRRYLRFNLKGNTQAKEERNR